MALLDDIATDISGDDCFYDTESGFAETATYLGNPFPILFEDDYFDLESGQTVVAGSQPRGWCRTADAPPINSSIIIRSITYTITNHEPNKDGETMVVLIEA